MDILERLKKRGYEVTKTDYDDVYNPLARYKDLLGNAYPMLIEVTKN